MNEIDLRCFYCLLKGSHEPPPVLTWVNGTAVCAAHLHEDPPQTGPGATHSAETSRSG